MNAVRAWLVPVSGPPLPPIEMTAVDAGATLGRGDGCQIKMPPEADKVSRQHARFVHDPIDHDGDGTPDSGGWRIADLGSRWGTTLNGVKLAPNREVPMSDGDLVRITPWTFSFSTQGVPKRGLLAQADEATHTTLVRSFAPGDGTAGGVGGGLAAEQPPAMGEDLLTLLLDAASAVHAAETETTLAEALTDAALRGTGLARAAVLRPLDTAGRIEVVYARYNLDGFDSNRDRPAGFSRSLLAAASNGSVAELADDATDISQSIVQLGISAAVCAPLMLGGSPAAYLYLDNHGSANRYVSPRKGAAAFSLALARMAGLALANLKRIDIEKRQAALELDLSAAAKAQKWILPKRVTTAGAFTCTGESRAGAYVGGDFFDVIDLGHDCMAVALGDVSGHGVAASVLMTAAQGFLHAALTQNDCRREGVAKAVTDLNRFIHPRRPASSFLTLWVGVFDATARTLTYVNAGHGYALLNDAGPGEPTMLDAGEDFPIGFMPDAEYGSTTVALPPGGRTVIVSDGIVEQFDPGRLGPREQFGLGGVRQILARPDADPAAALFAAVVAHAESEDLQDDATAVVVTWSG